jgi:hypothetical protein
MIRFRNGQEVMGLPDKNNPLIVGYQFSQGEPKRLSSRISREDHLIFAMPLPQRIEQCHVLSLSCR